ncbi:MAG: CHAT domain-containing protein [Nodosilinea sp.]
MEKILILAANPKTTSRLRLDQELRDIEAGLRRAQQRDQFTLVQRLAVRPRDIQRAMLDETPQIVHFSGHGEGAEGLVFEDDAGQAQRVSGEALANLFALFADPAEPNPIHCVVLNGCYSAVQAEAIAEQVPYVVGMTQEIGDTAAITFAVGFYDALGAGRSVEFAYRLGCAAINLAGKPESATPVLINKKAPAVPATPSENCIEIPIKENRYENCVSVNRLYAERKDTSTYSLNFAFNFGAQEVIVPGGKISFGLSKGELQLEIHEGSCKEFIKSKTDKLDVSPNGSPTRPIWVFKAKLPNNYMEESANMVIGELLMHGKTSIKATFKKRYQADLYLDDYEVIRSLFSGKNLSRNKMLVCLRLFYRQFLKPKLEPYLSMAELNELELNDINLPGE